MSFDTWTDGFIQAKVTLPVGAALFLNWQLIVAAFNPLVSTSRGDFEEEPAPTLSLSAPPSGPGVPEGGTSTFSLTVSSANASPLVQLSLSTTAGTGSAQFAGGVTSTTVAVPVTGGSGSTNITISGIQVSSTANNITLTATLQGSPGVTASIPLSVVSVTISLNTGQIDPDDAIPTRVNPQIPGLGPAIYPGPQGLQCVVFAELVGTVTPSNYTGLITLRRTGIQTSIYVGPDPNPALSKSNFEDTSLAIALYQNAAKGKVFDIDAPGVAGSGFISHYRANFQEYAVLGNASAELGNASSTVRASAVFPWNAALSCGGTAQAPVADNTIPNDNKAGVGAINTTWNLQ